MLNIQKCHKKGNDTYWDHPDFYSFTIFLTFDHAIVEGLWF